MARDQPHPRLGKSQRVQLPAESALLGHCLQHYGSAAAHGSAIGCYTTAAASGPDAACPCGGGGSHGIHGMTRQVTKTTRRVHAAKAALGRPWCRVARPRQVGLLLRSVHEHWCRRGAGRRRGDGVSFRRWSPTTANLKGCIDAVRSGWFKRWPV